MRILLTLLSLALFSPHASSVESLCATVKIEIDQELTLERQAFEASMKITNSLDTYDLSDVTVSLSFKDANGNPVVVSSNPNASSAAFYIRLDDTTGVTGLNDLEKGRVSGGTVPASTAAEIKWLIIPVPGAAAQNPSGELYYIGATLSYTYGGKTDELEVDADTIVVAPMPEMTLDYFLTQHVVGDDAFTEAVEAPVPYTLGVRIANEGVGKATSVALDSAQPKIIENKEGLSVGFTITGSYVNDSPAAETLLMNFGDIAPQGRTMGRWIMETTVSGTFTGFTATVSHADQYGGQLTSLIDAANTHFLIHDVLVDKAGRDSVKDFLGHDGDASELWVYESQYLGLSNSNCLDCSAVYSMSSSLSSATQTPSGQIRTLTPATDHDTFTVMKVADPYKGAMVLSQAVRSDNRVLNRSNAWLGKERSADKVNFDYFIYVFDYDVSGPYQLTFVESQEVPQAPVLQFVADKTTYEGNNVGFLVRASDPNGTLPSLSVISKPVGAVFTTDDSSAPMAKGVFSWTPSAGQTGSFPVTFIASDGYLSSEMTVTIKVNPASDTDGDGLPDDWEREYFGDLSQSPDGDYDNDGFTNLEEWEKGWNPLEAAKVPNVPTIKTPIYEGEVDTLAPELVITNSAHSSDIAVTYVYEVYADEAMTSLIMQVEGIAEDVDTTSVWLAVTADDVTIEDNHWYYWRVRAVSDEGGSEWAISRFFINTVNDEPSVPQVSQPEAGATVSVATPVLAVNNASDVDSNTLTYSFYLFADGNTSGEVLYSITGLAQGADVTSWQVPESLQEDTYYQWYAEVKDEEGAVTRSGIYRFLVSTQNDAPTRPVIHLPGKGDETQTLSPHLSWTMATDPEGAAPEYELQWSTDAEFSDYQSAEGILATGSDYVSYTLSDLTDNQTWYGRVRAFDGELYSDWVQSNFFVNTVNDAPLAPTLANPAEGAVVEVLTPSLSVNPVTDLDGDTVSYRFRVYRDAAMQSLIAEGVSTTTDWTVTASLPDNAWYYWYAQAEDEHGATSYWMAPAAFFVDNGGIDDAPEFTFVLPATDIELIDGDVLIQWVDSDPDSDASITLWYEGDGGDIGTIAENISENADGEGDQYSWHVSSLPVGNYLIKAIISDATNRVDATAVGTVSVIPNVGYVLTSVVDSAELDESGNNQVQVEVVLDRAPLSGTTVSVNLGVSDDTEAEIVTVTHNGESWANNYLYFTENTWDQPYTITLRGVDDCLIDGDQGVDLVLSGVASDDSGFNGNDPDDVALVNLDNEAPDQTLFLCSYVLQSKAVSGTHVTATYKAKIKNAGSDVDVVTATLGTSSNYTINGSNTLAFHSVTGGSLTESTDAFTVEYDETTGFDTGNLNWTISVLQTPGEELNDWSSEDIGIVLKPGSVSASGVNYDITSYGFDVGGLMDAFHFVYTTLNGDGELVARLDSFTAANGSARAGLMIRESSWLGSKNAFLHLTKSNGGYFTYRSTTSWATKTKSTFEADIGSWLRLAREGSRISAYVSSDATSWTKVGEVSVSMSDKVEVGLAVSSHQLLKSAEAGFGYVWVEKYSE